MASHEGLVREVQRLEALANELTLRCVLEGVHVADICGSSGGESAWRSAMHSLMPWTNPGRAAARRTAAVTPASPACFDAENPQQGAPWACWQSLHTIGWATTDSPPWWPWAQRGVHAPDTTDTHNTSAPTAN